MRITELIPVNGRKSFGGKAKVIDTENAIELLSYETIVAKYNKNSKKFEVLGKHSMTTNTHIKAFKNYLNL